jgi:hypothetical protein
MEARIGIGMGLTGTKSVRIEEAIYCQVEGKSKAGCPLAKQVSKTSLFLRFLCQNYKVIIITTVSRFFQVKLILHLTSVLQPVFGKRY